MNYINSIYQNTGVKIDQMDNTISLKSTELYTVVNNLSKDGEFKLEEVAYNTLLCEKYTKIYKHKRMFLS